MPDIKQIKVENILYDIKDDSIVDFTDEQIEEICSLSGGGTEEVIPVATNSILGCVSVGDGLSIDTDGKLSANLSGMTKEFLLWENPNPSASFAAQTINLDLSEYDQIKIVFNTYDTNTTHNIELFKINSIRRVALVNRSVTSSANTYPVRRVSTSSTGVTFSEGSNKSGESGTPTTADNLWLIPTHIYGIKVNKTTEVTDDTITITDTLPIERGGTGAMTPVNARANLELSGSTTETLLWTNASPTSEFATQTINLDLSSYDGIYTVFKYNNDSNDKSYRTSQLVRKGNKDTLLSAYSYTEVIVRDINVNSNSVIFGNGYNHGNSYLIPYKIYGVKVLD